MEEKKGDKLVRMANQIADFFGPYDEAEAIAGIHDHIHSFWTPAMRKDLLAFIQGGGSGLRPRAIAALERMNAAKPAESPIEKAVAGPKTLGQAASDAG